MRVINNIVIHCTATPQTATVKSILNYWKNKLKWKNPGYHFIIKPDGGAENLLPIAQISNGARGHNKDSLHISYIGGLHGDDRTEAQKETMLKIVKGFAHMFPNAKILGHRDFKGVKKACPNFDVTKWWNQNKDS